jgi:hypothetical protein
MLRIGQVFWISFTLFVGALVIQNIILHRKHAQQIQNLSQEYNVCQYDPTMPPSPAAYDIMRLSGFRLYVQSSPIILDIDRLPSTCGIMCQIMTDKDKNFTIPKTPKCIDLDDDSDNCQNDAIDESRCLWTICEHHLSINTQLFECRCVQRWQCHRSCSHHFQMYLFLNLKPHPIEKVINETSDLSSVQILGATQRWTTSSSVCHCEMVDQNPCGGYTHSQSTPMRASTSTTTTDSILKAVEKVKSQGDHLIWVRKRDDGIIEFTYNRIQDHLFKWIDPVIDFRINVTSPSPSTLDIACLCCLF